MVIKIKMRGGDLVHLKRDIYARVEESQNGDERVTVYRVVPDYSPCGESPVMEPTLKYRKLGQVELSSEEV